MACHLNSTCVVNSSPCQDCAHSKVSITVHVSNADCNFNNNSISSNATNPQPRNISLQKQYLQLPDTSHLDNETKKTETKGPRRRCNSMNELTLLTKTKSEDNFSPATIPRRSSSYHGQRFLDDESETNLVDGLLTTDLCSTEL